MSTELVELPQGCLARPSLLAPASAGWDELAEQSVLGALLLLPNLASDLLTMLVAEDFFSPCHRKIFLAAGTLRDEDSPIDLITVNKRLAGDADFEGRGGRSYLAGLPALSVPALHATEHARIVKELSTWRQTQTIAQMLFEGRISPANASEALLKLGADAPAHLLPSISALEFCQQVPEEPDWILDGYLARGVITELDAKIKTGKTHFACDLIRAVLAGEEFLGHKTVLTPVLYLTEERPTTFRAALGRAGLENAGALHLTFKHETHASWPEVGRGIIAEAKTLNVGLVVCDTLSVWSGIEIDKENDAGAAMEAMRPLENVAAGGIAVLALRHERKSGGEVGDAARGSSAFGGAADILLSLKKDPAPGHENRRILEGVGRLEGTPPKLVLEMLDNHYLSLGTSAQVETEAARRLLASLLSDSEDEALPEKEILAQAEGQVSRSTLKREMDRLMQSGALHREKGVGAASPKAFGFWLDKGARL